ncbi:hypothetical protein [Nocardia sp. XZ_19_385]|uniref:hypothetical protein n=1 Tax=Nocardia sp. XZ_19_385 TaxID=2769488 RepID=UPI001890AF1F|nr:hypothetical protein [Nocardia sp. XZ_19_385]
MPFIAYADKKFEGQSVIFSVADNQVREACKPKSSGWWSEFPWWLENKISSYSTYRDCAVRIFEYGDDPMSGAPAAANGWGDISTAEGDPGDQFPADQTWGAGLWEIPTDDVLGNGPMRLFRDQCERVTPERGCSHHGVGNTGKPAPFGSPDPVLITQVVNCTTEMQPTNVSKEHETTWQEHVTVGSSIESEFKIGVVNVKATVSSEWGREWGESNKDIISQGLNTPALHIGQLWFTKAMARMQGHHAFREEEKNKYWHMPSEVLVPVPTDKGSTTVKAFPMTDQEKSQCSNQDKKARVSDAPRKVDKLQPGKPSSDQAAKVGMSFGKKLGVQALADGKPVAGVQVTFEVDGDTNSYFLQQLAKTDNSSHQTQDGLSELRREKVTITTNDKGWAYAPKLVAGDTPGQASIKIGVEGSNAKAVMKATVKP